MEPFKSAYQVVGIKNFAFKSRVSWVIILLKDRVVSLKIEKIISFQLKNLRRLRSRNSFKAFQ